MKLCLSGGHITPAIALAQYALDNGDQVSLIGRRYTDAHRTKLSQEAAIATQYGLNYISLDPPKTPTNLPSALTFPPRLISSIHTTIKNLRHQKPDCVVSFGGYVGVPVVLAARTLSIPILIHEQTLRPGLANSFTGLFANHIAVGFKSSAAFFPAYKTTYTGNPLRQEIQSQAPKPQWFSKSSKPLLFITGGSQGSEFINQLVVEVLPQLQSHYQVCLQSGQGDMSSKKLISLTHRPYLNALEMAYFLQSAHLVISRAGANIISESMYLGLVSLCIPLPVSRSGEQLHNARYLESLGQSMTLIQSQATPDSLISALQAIEANYSKFKMRAKASATAFPPNATQKIYQCIHQLCA